jgi:hypothetical protein
MQPSYVIYKLRIFNLQTNKIFLIFYLINYKTVKLILIIINVMFR